MLHIELYEVIETIIIKNNLTPNSPLGAQYKKIRLLRSTNKTLMFVSKDCGASHFAESISISKHPNNTLTTNPEILEVRKFLIEIYNYLLC